MHTMKQSPAVIIVTPADTNYTIASLKYLEHKAVHKKAQYTHTSGYLGPRNNT